MVNSKEMDSSWSRVPNEIERNVGDRLLLIPYSAEIDKIEWPIPAVTECIFSIALAEMFDGLHSSQFQQHFTSSFFANFLSQKKLQAQTTECVTDLD